MSSEHVKLVLFPARVGFAFRENGMTVLTTLPLDLSLGLLRR